MNIQPFILIACIFSGCVKTPKHVQCSDQVNKVYKSQLEQTIPCVVLGCGGYYAQTTVDQFYVDLEVVGSRTKGESKELLTQLTDQYLQVINSSEEMQPHLTTSPMTYNQISLSLAFVDEKHKPVNGLAQIYLFEGNVYFSEFDLERKDYTNIGKEPYAMESITDSLDVQPQ